MNLHKIYVVHWRDAWRNQSYYGEENDYTALDVVDVGFLMEENDDTVVLASSIEMDKVHSGRHMSVIPWEYIVSMEELV